MALVKRPIITFRDERPLLLGDTDMAGIFADVSHGSANVVGVIEEYLPSAAGPDWVIVYAST